MHWLINLISIMFMITSVNTGDLITIYIVITPIGTVYMHNSYIVEYDSESW